MKITVYTLATSTDYDFNLKTYATKEARDNAARQLLTELWTDGGFDPSERPDFATCDIADVWCYVRKDDTDSLWLEDSEIEIAAPLTAGQLQSTEKPVRIGVVVEGGLIQGVFADGPAPQVYVIDYDVDSDDHPSIVEIPQDDGETANASVCIWSPDTSNPSGANETFNAIDVWDKGS